MSLSEKKGWGFAMTGVIKTCQVSEMELFAKIVNSIKHFYESHYLKSLADFLIHLSGF